MTATHLEYPPNVFRRRTLLRSSAEEWARIYRAAAGRSRLRFDVQVRSLAQVSQHDTAAPSPDNFGPEDRA